MGGAALPIAVGAQAGGGVISAIGQGQAGRSQADYFNYLSSIAGINKGLDLARGTMENKEIGAQTFQQQQGLTRRISQTIGRQVAGSVNGAGASSRTAQDIVRDTVMGGNLDEEALRVNAAMRSKNAIVGSQMAAINDEAQATGYNVASMNTRAATTMNQFSSILGSTGSVASNWYRTPWNYSPQPVS